MKRLLLIAIIACFFSSTAFTQISFGPKVGVNFSKYGYSYKESYNEPEVTFRFGQSVGAVLNLQITSFLAFQPSANISIKGVAHNVNSWDSGQAVYTGYDRVRITYFETPLNLALGIRLGQGQIQVFAGPYLAVAIIGVERWDYERNEDGIREQSKDIEKVKFRNTVSEEDHGDEDVAFYQKPFDYGVNFGLGYKYKHLLFNAGFAMGLANLQPDTGVDFDPKDYKYSNRTIFITAAWLFGGE
ncbi:MAG: PorT family protein [Bacteroidales bacterium]|nr:PorT family protein [Bacteroidales bacterium]